MSSCGIEMYALENEQAGKDRDAHAGSCRLGWYLLVLYIVTHAVTACYAPCSRTISGASIA